MAGACLALADAPADAPGEPNAVQAGHVTVQVWNNLPHASVEDSYPDEIPWECPAADAQRLTLPIEGIEQGEGLFALRLRCLLTAPADGYYQIAFEGSGSQQILLSDDATPERAHEFWIDGHAWDDFLPGFADTFLRTEAPWRYFKQGQARYLEVRQIHTMGPRVLNFAWTLPDGTRQKIPATCVTNYLPPEKDVAPSNGLTPEGDRGESLKAEPVKPVRIDLKSAKPMSSGWVWYDGKGTTTTSDRIAPKPDVTQPALACSFGGDIEFPFVTTSAGYAVISTQIQLCNCYGNYAHVFCEREIDGVRLKRETLRALNGSAPAFRCLTPWLAAGNHTLKLHFTRAYNGASSRIFGIAVQGVTGNY